LQFCTDSVPRPSKCTEIVGGWGFAPDPTGGAYSAPPDPQAGLRGPTSKRRGGEGRKGRVREGRGGEGILLRNSFRGLVTPLIWRKIISGSWSEPKNPPPPQTPFLGARDGQNLISWRWSLPLPTNPVW